jgi:hypothetical protein
MKRVKRVETTRTWSVCHLVSDLDRGMAAQPASLTAPLLRQHTDGNRPDKTSQVLSFLAGVQLVPDLDSSSPAKSQASVSSSTGRRSLVASMRARTSRSETVSSPILKARVDESFTSSRAAKPQSKTKTTSPESQQTKKRSRQSKQSNKPTSDHSNKENYDPRKGRRQDDSEDVDDVYARS